MATTTNTTQKDYEVVIEPTTSQVVFRLKKGIKSLCYVDNNGEIEMIHEFNCTSKPLVFRDSERLLDEDEYVRKILGNLNPNKYYLFLRDGYILVIAR